MSAPDPLNLRILYQLHREDRALSAQEMAGDEIDAETLLARCEALTERGYLSYLDSSHFEITPDGIAHLAHHADQIGRPNAIFELMERAKELQGQGGEGGKDRGGGGGGAGGTVIIDSDETDFSGEISAEGGKGGHGAINEPEVISKLAESIVEEEFENIEEILESEEDLGEKKASLTKRVKIGLEKGLPTVVGEWETTEET